MNPKLRFDLERQRRNADHARQQRAARSRRHRGTSNLKYARRPDGWREWLAVLLLKRTFKHQSKPIPVTLRPWLRANWHQWTVKDYRAALKAAKVPAHQWAALERELIAITPEWLSQQEAQREERARRIQFEAWCKAQYEKRAVSA